MQPVTSAVVDRMRRQLFFEGDDVRQRLSRFWLLLPLAAVIASAGIVGDSTATVIGAMIVAPLMAPILGTVLAVVLADRRNLVTCLLLLVTGSLAVIAIGWLMGWVISAPVVAATNGQVAARVTPKVIDLVAALATGAVGAIALARDDIADTLPGVAIAISLVPPLAVVGLTLESGEQQQAAGALLLFLTNVSAILAMGLLVMSVYRVRFAVPVAEATADGARPVHRGRATAVIVAALAVVAVPLVITSARVAETRTTENRVADIAGDWAERTGWSVASVTATPDGVVVVVTGELPEPRPSSLRAALERAGLGGTRVRVELVPTHTVELRPGD